MPRGFDLLTLLESGFDLKQFKDLNSYRECLNYATSHLEKLGTGSSRVVFQLGDKVLKIAKNKKGLQQNSSESDYSIQYSFIAKTFENHPDDLWVIAEHAKKVTVSEFGKVVGVPFNSFTDFIKYEAYRSGGTRSKPTMTREQATDLWENEFCSEISEFMVNYDLAYGDLIRIGSFGVVNRKGKSVVVLRDYGLTNQTYNDYYHKN